MTEIQTMRLAVDIGGTFTDVVIETPAGRFIAKVLTTPTAPEDGFFEGCAIALRRAGIAPGALDLIVHGTTLATNALIERRGARIGFVATQGFRDCLEMAYEHRFEQADAFMVRPPPLVPRALRFEVPERMAADGTVLLPLDEVALRRVAAELRAAAVEAVALGFLHSYANPAHERAAGRILEAELPGVAISLSADVSPEIREYDRFSTTAANAYVRPLMDGYLRRLEEGLRARGFRCPILMMMSSGGMTTVETARRLPVRLVESGPAGGAILARNVAAECGRRTVLSFDMGGTTAKVCFVDDYQPQLSRAFEVAREVRFLKGSGLPVRIPVIEMVEIGAGGGSVAGLGPLGTVEVGPESAGSVPGPACYGRGGTRPAVTDADLVLGRIDPQGFAGGSMVLDVSLAEGAIARHVGRDVAIGATAISEIVDENMANAARVHGVELGKEVERRTIIAFGGAAPLHAARVAEKIGCPEVIIPVGAGVGSAVGFLRAPIAYEVVRTRLTSLADFPAAMVAALLAAMREEALEVLRLATVPETLAERRTAYMRYRGQGHEIAVPLPPGAPDGEALRASFEEHYARLYGRIIPGLGAEVVTWSLSLSAAELLPEPRGPLAPVAPPEPTGHRPIVDTDTGETLLAPIYRRAALPPGTRLHGPALISEDETTTYVTARFEVTVTAGGHLLLSRRSAL